MKTPVLVTLAVAFVLATECCGAADEVKRPNYSDKSLAEWIDVLKDADEARCAEARQALCPEGPYAKTAIPALIDALDADALCNLEIVHALAEYGTPAVEPLIRALKSPKTNIRQGAAMAFQVMRPRATKAVPALIEAIKDQDRRVQGGAADALSIIGIPGDKATLGLVAEVLKDERVEVRFAMLLAFIGNGPVRGGRPPPATAIPLLIKTLNDKNEPNVRDAALQAIANVEPSAKDAVPDLIEALHNKELSEHRRGIVDVLGGIGPDAKAAVPDLLELLKGDDDDLKSSAMFALSSIGLSAKAAVPEILKIAVGKAKGDRLDAMRALGNFGADAKDAVPTLIESLKGRGKDARLTAIKALGAMGPVAKDAVPELIEALNIHKPYTDAYDVIKALRAIGSDANAAVPVLMELARDRSTDSHLREYAARAVMAIDPKTGAKEQMEIAHLNIRLGKIPALKLVPRPALTEEKKKQIKALIAKLAKIEDLDYEPEPKPWNLVFAFAPVDNRAHFSYGLLTGHGLRPGNAFSSLVELGPDALPFLLEALDDKTPTQLFIGGMRLRGCELGGNYLNPVERRVFSKARKEDEDPHTYDDLPVWPRTFKVGDVCFLAIGEITARPYRVIQLSQLGSVGYNSPVGSKSLRDRVREIWKSDDAAKRLLESLLLDYAAEDVFNFNGWSLDGLGEAGEYQIKAAVRLLYYFPKESAPLIADRMRSLDVMKPPNDKRWMLRDVRNGVRVEHFIKAVSWCKESAIQEALADIGKRTNDEAIKNVLPEGVK